MRPFEVSGRLPSDRVAALAATSRGREVSVRKLLVLNCGSSSLKYHVFDATGEHGEARGLVERIGEEGTRHTYDRPGRETVSEDLARGGQGGGGHAAAFASMVEMLTAPATGVLASTREVGAVGHRVVHGGEEFTRPTVLTPAVIARLEALSELAPLHNPVNLAGIREAMRLFPEAAHVAVFDTSFHHTLPPRAYLYGLPYEYYEAKKIRRYGFHGMSHAYVTLRAAEFLGRRREELAMVSCHLGNGASACAVDHGRSVDTSMGFTPAEGLIMGTRSGSLDPAILLHLMRAEGMTPEALDRLINHESGLLGLSGLSNDMREIERAAARGERRAQLAFEAFCYQVRKMIGAYAAAMGALDVLIFTGGIGQGSAAVRGEACRGLEIVGVAVDEERNRAARGFEEVTRISPAGGRAAVLVVPTDEERMIARETRRAIEASTS